ncbi:MAG: hypothetical protein M3Y77_14765 [Actinomycetota bacterium]|nr:hypothetical protein [Actinomycetota bacterium]
MGISHRRAFGGAAIVVAAALERPGSIRPRRSERPSTAQLAGIISATSNGRNTVLYEDVTHLDAAFHVDGH